MKLAGFFFALCLVLSLSSCLEAQKVTALDPSAGDKTTASSAILSLPRTALAELGRSADQLRVRAFRVDSGVPGAEAREAYQFPVTDAGLYTMEALPLGELEFQVELLDERDQVLAAGSLRATINPGSQTLPQLVLKPAKPNAVEIDLSLSLQLVGFPETPAVTPVEPEAVRTLFKTYKCQTCHNSGARPTAGLDLQSYPYKNSADESIAQILTKVLNSFTGSNGAPKMPPNAMQVQDAEINAVRDFLQRVTEAGQAGQEKWVQDVRLSVNLGAGGRYETSLSLKDGVYVLNDRINLIAASRYAYTLTVVGPGGSKLYEVEDAALDVPLDGRVQLQVDLVYQAPLVTLPVVVEE
jgi:mono/diheme cytochrome c family protein